MKVSDPINTEIFVIITRTTTALKKKYMHSNDCRSLMLQLTIEILDFGQNEHHRTSVIALNKRHDANIDDDNSSSSDPIER